MLVAGPQIVQQVFYYCPGSYWLGYTFSCRSFRNIELIDKLKNSARIYVKHLWSYYLLYTPILARGVGIVRANANQALQIAPPSIECPDA